MWSTIAPNWAATGFGSIGMSVVWILIIAVLAQLLRWFAGSFAVRDGEALSKLERRYARGEIDREEFERRKHALGR